MSLFSTQQDNDLQIRAQHVYGENFHIKDPGTGNWVPFTPAGDSVTLPYYLHNDYMQFEGSSMVNGSYITQVDNVMNTILPAHEASLEELETRVIATEAANTSQTNSIISINNRIANLNSSAGRTTLGYSAANANRLLIDSSGVYIQDSSAGAGPTYPQIRLAREMITISPNSTTGSALDYNDFKYVNDLQTVASVDHNKITLSKDVALTGLLNADDITGKKMLLVDETTKAVSYTDIPSGGSTLPYYIKTNEIDLASTSGDTTNGITIKWLLEY